MPELPAGLTVRNSSLRGRGIFATKSFKPGDTVTWFEDDTTTIVLPDGPHQDQICNHCLSLTKPVKACTGCKAITYCGPACQKANWSLVHSKECKAFKKIKDEGHQYLPTPVRALLQVLAKPGFSKAIDELEGHVTEFKADEKAWSDLELQTMAALYYTGKEPSQDQLSNAVERLCKVNSFNRLDADIGQNGLFINPALAMVNHSCVPNAFVQFVGRKAILKAYQAIRENEEILISYIDCNLHRPHRKQALQERYHFDCLCPRCQDDLDVYQVTAKYSHLELNSYSLAPPLKKLKHAPVKISFHSSAELQQIAKETYEACSLPLQTNSPSDGVAELRRRWKSCELLVKAKLYAIEPIPQILADASSQLASEGYFIHSLCISCFISVHCDSYRNPAPFSPQRVKGLFMVAMLLSNTAPEVMTTGDKSQLTPLAGRIVDTLKRYDQVSLCQGILNMIICYAPMAHSDEWQILAQAQALLKDIESLPGREKESEAIRNWTPDTDDIEANAFAAATVLKPTKELAAFALEIMDTMLGNDTALVKK